MFTSVQSTFRKINSKHILRFPLASGKINRKILMEVFLRPESGTKKNDNAVTQRKRHYRLIIKKG